MWNDEGSIDAVHQDVLAVLKKHEATALTDGEYDRVDESVGMQLVDGPHARQDQLHPEKVFNRTARLRSGQDHDDDPRSELKTVFAL